MAAEAKKHNLTLEQFKQIQMMQQKRLEAEAAKAGMTPQQFIMMQQKKLHEEAAKAGMSPQQFLAMKQQEAIQAQRQAQQQAQQGGQPPANGQPGGPPKPGQPQMQRIDLNKPVEPKPDALAVAKYLRSQDLKLRSCIFDGQRKDMFKGERAFSLFIPLSTTTNTPSSQARLPSLSVTRLRKSPCQRPPPPGSDKRSTSAQRPAAPSS